MRLSNIAAAVFVALSLSAPAAQAATSYRVIGAADMVASVTKDEGRVIVRLSSPPMSRIRARRTDGSELEIYSTNDRVTIADETQEFILAVDGKTARIELLSHDIARTQAPQEAATDESPSVTDNNVVATNSTQQPAPVYRIQRAPENEAQPAVGKYQKVAYQVADGGDSAQSQQFQLRQDATPPFVLVPMVTQRVESPAQTAHSASPSNATYNNEQGGQYQTIAATDANDVQQRHAAQDAPVQQVTEHNFDVPFAAGKAGLGPRGRAAMASIAQAAATADRITIFARPDGGAARGAQGLRIAADRGMAMQQALAAAGIQVEKISVKVVSSPKQGSPAGVWASNIDLDSVTTFSNISKAPISEQAAKPRPQWLGKQMLKDHAPTVVAEAAAQPKPMIKRNWTLSTDDHTLSAALKRWGGLVGLDVVWTGGDYPIDYAASFDAMDFDAALNEVLESLKTAEQPMRAVYYANNVVRIIPLTAK
jgi:hypothetical protein